MNIGPPPCHKQGADIVFHVGAEHGVLTSSGVAAFAPIEALGVAVARQAKDPFDAATAFTERVLPGRRVFTRITVASATTPA